MSETGESLFQAVRRNDVSRAAGALKRGASVNYIHVEEDRVMRACVPVLYQACKNQNTQLVELLLAHGADPNAEYNESATWGSEHEPCLFAALRPERPSVQIVRALLEGGADPNIPRVWRENFNNNVAALDIAGNRGNPKLVTLLKQCGARDHNRNVPEIPGNQPGGRH